MERIIIRIACAVNRFMEKITDVVLPLAIVVMSLITTSLGITYARSTDIPDYIYGAVVCIGGGIVLWIIAISLAIGGLYDSE